MNPVLHDSQKLVAIDTHRFRTVVAGRRWGKSVLASWEMLAFALYNNDSRVVYIAPTIKQARDIVWAMLKKVTQSAWVKEPNETRLEMEVKTNNGGTSTIWLRGGENIESLRGLKIDFLVIDETQNMRNWSSTWGEVLRPTLTDTKGQALFIGTPKGYTHFWDLFNLEKKDEDYKSFKFTSYDNPFIPKEEIDKAKIELDEDTFAQEYLAEFKKYTGLVYKAFNRDKHVIEPRELSDSWTYYRGLDFGFVHPTGVLFMAVDSKGVIYVYDEIYMTGVQTPDLANLIKQKSGGRMITSTIADSAQQSDISELQKYGLGITPVSKTSGSNSIDWTTHKIRRVTEKIQNNKLFVFKNCVNTIMEFENYQYHEVNDYGQVKEVPMKINDHLMDALAYVVVNLPEWVEPQFGYERGESLPVDDLFQGGFY